MSVACNIENLSDILENSIRCLKKGFISLMELQKVNDMSKSNTVLFAIGGGEFAEATEVLDKFLELLKGKRGF